MGLAKGQGSRMRKWSQLNKQSVILNKQGVKRGPRDPSLTKSKGASSEQSVSSLKLRKGQGFKSNKGLISTRSQGS